jgi:hypothetical protein
MTLNKSYKDLRANKNSRSSFDELKGKRALTRVLFNNITYSDFVVEIAIPEVVPL